MTVQFGRWCLPWFLRCNHIRKFQMKIYMRRCLFLGLLACCAEFCFAAKFTLPPIDAAHPYVISPIVVLGKNMVGNRVGFTVFGNEYFSDEHQGEMNDSLESVLVAALQRIEGVSVKKSPIAYQPLWDVLSKKRSMFQMRSFPDGVYGILKQENVAEGVDAFLLAVPGGNNENCKASEGCSGYGSSGYGLLERRGLYAYISVYIALIDAKTLEELNYWKASASIPLEPTKWHSSWSGYGADEQEMVYSLIRAMFSSKVPKVLQFMGITREPIDFNPGSGYSESKK